MPPTPSAPKVEYRHNVAKAQHEIGVRVGKVYVPFAAHSDAYFAQLVENFENTAAVEDEGGEDE